MTENPKSCVPREEAKPVARGPSLRDLDVFVAGVIAHFSEKPVLLLETTQTNQVHPPRQLKQKRFSEQG